MNMWTGGTSALRGVEEDVATVGIRDAVYVLGVRGADSTADVGRH